MEIFAQVSDLPLIFARISKNLRFPSESSPQMDPVNWGLKISIDSGFEDPQMMSLLERIGVHRPNEERRTMISVVAGH